MILTDAGPLVALLTATSNIIKLVCDSLVNAAGPW